MARHHHHRVPLGQLGHLLETARFDAREQLLEDPTHGGRQARQDRRVHVGGDLAEHLLRPRPRRFDRDLLVRGRLDRGHDRGVAHHGFLDLVARPQRRPLDGAFLAGEELHDRAPELARGGELVRLFVLLDEGGDVERVSHLDRQVPIGQEERRHLREVGRPAGRAVVEVEEATLGPRTLAPEERQRDERHLAAFRGRGIDDLAQHLEFTPPVLDRGLAPAHLGREPRGPQEEEHRLAGADGAMGGLLRVPRILVATCLSEEAATRQPVSETAQERLVVVEGQPVREGREPQPLASEQGVEQEVVEPARIAHDVHDGAALLERAKPRHGRVIEIEVREIAPREPAKEEVETQDHRRRGIGGGSVRRSQGLARVRVHTPVSNTHSARCVFRQDRPSRMHRGGLRPASRQREPAPRRELPPSTPTRQAMFRRLAAAGEATPPRTARQGPPRAQSSRMSDIRAATSSGLQRPPSSVLVTPSAVTTRISAIRPPPT